MPPKRKLADSVDVGGEQSSDLSSAPEDRSPSKRKKGAAATTSPAKKRGRPSAVKSKDSTADVTAVADARAAAALDADAKKNETTAGSAMPNNKTMPESLSYERPKEGAIRVCAWNVCGLTSSQKKGFKTYVGAEDPDILILTETKLSNRPLDPYLTNRYAYQYWSDAVQGHGGTSILSKLPVIRATYSLPGHEDPSEVAGRLVTLEFEKLFLVGTYVPNAGQGLKFMDRKKAWNVAFEEYIRTLDAQKPVIWAGDLNVVPTALDIKRPKENYNKSAGYTQIEIDGFNRILNPTPAASTSTTPSTNAEKLVDVWRHLHPTDPHYSYFSYRFNCRMKGIGWRLDFFILSKRLMPKVQACEIRHEAYGASDHLPIILDIEGPL